MENLENDGVTLATRIQESMDLLCVIQLGLAYVAMVAPVTWHLSNL